MQKNIDWHSITSLDPIDYLVIGHLTVDLTPDGPRLGGTAAYSSLTAQSLGLRVGVVTSWGQEIPSNHLQNIQIINYSTDRSTTFENIPTEQGRLQFIHNIAPSLNYQLIPEIWRNTPIIHLGPIAQEVEPDIIRHFPSALVCLTPQGWLRAWDKNGQVYATEWPEATFMLQQAGAVVISVEDVGGDEGRIEEMASASRILAVTEADEGSRLYWNGDVRRFRPPSFVEVDATGAGDIYAAAFFTRLHTTRDPWEAARFATQLSAFSVSRPGLAGIPTYQEIEECLVEVL